MFFGDYINSGQVQYVCAVTANIHTDGQLDMYNFIQRAWKSIGAFELPSKDLGSNIYLAARKTKLTVLDQKYSPAISDNYL